MEQGKVLITYRSEFPYGDGDEDGMIVHYGHIIEDSVVSFLESIKKATVGPVEFCYILSVVSLTKEEAARIEEMDLNTF